MVNVSTASEEYVFMAGYHDVPRTAAVTTHANYACYFKYDRASNGDFLSAVIDDGAAETEYVMDGGGGRTTAAVADATFMKLKIIVDPVADTAKFYVNDVLKYTETANNPVNGTTPMASSVRFVKTVGTTARVAKLVWLRNAMIYTTPI
jgi:hypothetical protein